MDTGSVFCPGALLSQLVSPVYLKSIIVGSMCNIPHLQRALFDRLALGFNGRRLPEPFRLTSPQILPTCYQVQRVVQLNSFPF